MTKPTNAFCPCCRKHYRRSPSLEGRQKRCKKCSKGMQGKPLDWVDPWICPQCGEYKHKTSGVCRDCYEAGFRARKTTVIEELIRYAE
jgi:hypothetical protein